MLERKVMMPDGIVRDHHTIVQITHLVGQSTFADVLSERGDGTRGYSWQFSVSYDSTIDEGDAYALLEGLPEMAEYVDPVDELLDILTDEQAEGVATLYPAWAEGVAYAVGDRRRYGELLYRCVQAHTSQIGWEPPRTPAMWARTAEDPADVPEWVQPTGAHDAYARGDRVRHDGRTWVSTIDANTYEPGVYGWDEE